MPNQFNFGTHPLTIQAALDLATGKIKGVLAKPAIEKINASRDHVQQIVDNNTIVYGINTGFGILSNTRISAEDTTILQHKILQSHSVGVGDPVREVVVGHGGRTYPAVTIVLSVSRLRTRGSPRAGR